MKNYVLRYGLIAGVVNIGLGLLNWFTVAQIYGPTLSQTLGYLSIAVGLLCVPLGIRYFRDQINGGLVSFNKSMSVGLGITLIASLITFLYSILFFVFAGDSFDEWNKRGLSTAELEELEIQIAQTPDFVFTAWFQGFILFLSVFLIGLIISLISAMILKRASVSK